VLACAPVCAEHIRLEVETERLPPSAPGQFLQLLCHEPPVEMARLLDWPEGTPPAVDHDNFATDQTLLRRPFSIADRWESEQGRSTIAIISRAIGRGTRWLEQLRAGDTLDITGPLGQPFRLPDRQRPVLLVGGGVGIPPMLYLARRLHQQAHRDATAIFGVMSANLLPVPLVDTPATDGAPVRCLALPADAPYPGVVTTDDGSLGLAGRVTDAIERWRNSARVDQKPLVYACGPEPMLAAVGKLTRALDMDCQLCIERMMGCGLGTCLSCVVRVRDAAAQQGWRWALSCSEGPVFDRDELIDEAEWRTDMPWPGTQERT
jgi:dihydroorotate dehydrogenase electron transfer subunit